MIRKAQHKDLFCHLKHQRNMYIKLLRYL